MSQFVNESNIRLEPCDVFWGIREQQTITAVADASGSLNDTYFEFDAYNSAYQLEEYYVWFNVNSAGTDPAIAGKTGVEVALATDATAAAVASAIATELDALAVIRSAVASSAECAVIMERFGDVSDFADGASAPGFSYVVDQEGKGGAMGATSGGIELTPEIGSVEVTSDQTGGQILDNIMNANNVSVALTLQEITASLYQDLLGSVAGDSLTPSGGTQVVGVGESKRFQNMKQYAGELILVPVGAADNSRNHYFWKAAPMIESVNFSGEDIQQMPVAFNCYRDTSKDSKINIWAFGDGTQNLDA